MMRPRSRRYSGRGFLRWTAIALFAIALVVTGTLVFFRVQAGWRETMAPAHAAPAPGRLVRAADVAIYVQEAGPATGRPVLLIHGTGAWSEIWRETMTALAQAGYRAIAIDVPPFGFSEKPRGADAYGRARQAARIVGVLDALALRRVTLVAHSVGGRPGVETALLAPDRIERLILVDPALGFAPDGSRFAQNDPPLLLRQAFAIEPLRNALLASTGSNPLLTAQLFKGFVSRAEAVTPERVAMLQRPLVVLGATRGYGDWFSYLMIAPDAAPSAEIANLGRLAMPVAIIWGRTDTVTPLWQGEALQRRIGQATLTIIEGVGHIPYIEDAAAFHAILLRTLAAP